MAGSNLDFGLSSISWRKWDLFAGVLIHCMLKETKVENENESIINVDKVNLIKIVEMLVMLLERLNIV